MNAIANDSSQVYSPVGSRLRAAIISAALLLACPAVIASEVDAGEADEAGESGAAGGGVSPARGT